MTMIAAASTLLEDRFGDSSRPKPSSRCSTCGTGSRRRRWGRRSFGWAEAAAAIKDVKFVNHCKIIVPVGRDMLTSNDGKNKKPLR
jgi:hypothetical protein